MLSVASDLGGKVGRHAGDYGHGQHSDGSGKIHEGSKAARRPLRKPASVSAA
jgi:hypothetical protein